MTSVAGRPMTAEGLGRRPEREDGWKEELVRGEVAVSPPPSFEHGRVQGRAYYLLETYARASGRGRVTVESGQPTETDPDTVRGPDVAFWSFARLPAEQTPRVYPDVAADVIVEVMSPGDSDRRVQEKVREYLARGVRGVWVLDAQAHTATVYRQPGQGQVLWEGETLTDEAVLPGFVCRVAEFFG